LNNSILDELSCFVSKEGVIADTADCVHILYDVAVKMRAQRMLELGVREGVSTRALLLAARKNGGLLWSADIDPCLEAQKAIKDLGLNIFWSFHQIDDIKLLTQVQFHRIEMDLIFVDTNHEYQHTLDELILCDQILRKGGVIIIHDTQAPDYPDEIKAVNYFLSIYTNYIYEELGTKYGLGMLTKK